MFATRPKKSKHLIPVTLGAFLIVVLCFSCQESTSEEGQGLIQEEEGHPAAKVIEGFHLMSYYAGTISTSTEFVSYGCKKLALSATLTDEELSVLLPHAQKKADEFGIPMIRSSVF